MVVIIGLLHPTTNKVFMIPRNSTIRNDLTVEASVVARFIYMLTADIGLSLKIGLCTHHLPAQQDVMTTERMVPQIHRLFLIELQVNSEVKCRPMRVCLCKLRNCRRDCMQTITNHDGI